MKNDSINPVPNKTVLPVLPPGYNYVQWAKEFRIGIRYNRDGDKRLDWTFLQAK